MGDTVIIITAGITVIHIGIWATTQQFNTQPAISGKIIIRWKFNGFVNGRCPPACIMFSLKNGNLIILFIRLIERTKLIIEIQGFMSQVIDIGARKVCRIAKITHFSPALKPVNADRADTAYSIYKLIIMAVAFIGYKMKMSFPMCLFFIGHPSQN